MAENKEKEAKGTLKIGEPHPMACVVGDYIGKWTNSELVTAREAMASCAIEGNRAAEVCGETLDRLRKGGQVIDHYFPVSAGARLL